MTVLGGIQAFAVPEQLGLPKTGRILTFKPSRLHRAGALQQRVGWLPKDRACKQHESTYTYCAERRR